jgi:Predicted oxidoreductases (related to aryl-alcohol dehydrogenases)
MAFLVKGLTDAAKNAAVSQLEAVAGDLGCSLAQLSIAWAARNPRVSTVITGASRTTQLHDNLGAVDVISKLTPEVMARIDEIALPLAN